VGRDDPFTEHAGVSADFDPEAARQKRRKEKHPGQERRSGKQSERKAEREHKRRERERWQKQNKLDEALQKARRL
jgi:hypothetical protein